MSDAIAQAAALLEARLGADETYVQLVVAVVALALSWKLSARIAAAGSDVTMLRRIVARSSNLLLPLISALSLMVAAAVCKTTIGEQWLLHAGVMLVLLWLLEAGIGALQPVRSVAWMLRIAGVLLVVLHLSGVLRPILMVLESMSLEIGSLRISAGGVLRVIVFGSLLGWLGWMFNRAGVTAIRRQQRLDLRTREVVAKLFQIGLTLLVSLLMLQVMGISLTALAVFGGALGVGLGFGLQSIASNFISGIIILFDRSLSVGDYVEIEGGQSGYVRELTLRYTTLEAFDGKTVLVPNETFITKAFTNWTHRDHRQRYRVDFSVAYATDVRKLCQLIRETVASHPQVISGDDLPIELRPDCEIDSFGDSGVNMFVEFWIEGIDDGRNRVGGDLLLLIFEALRENGVEIPFPQREVRMLPS